MGERVAEEDHFMLKVRSLVECEWYKRPHKW